jgi:ADP-ribose pyrophosphatase
MQVWDAQGGGCVRYSAADASLRELGHCAENDVVAAALQRRLWELPAGLLDEPGEVPQVAAARELREETGLVADDWRVLIDVALSPGFCDEAVRVYLARGLREVGRPAADHEEADMTVHRVGLEHAVAQVLSGEIANATAAAGVLAAYAAVVDGRPTRAVDAPWPDRPTAFAARRRA